MVAVNILILFAIMLVNKRQDYASVKYGALRNVVTGVVCLGLFALLGVTVTSTNWAIAPNIAKLPSTMVVIGQHFFSDYLLPFELASILLLVSLIGAIVLARREFIPDTFKVDLKVSEESLELLEKPKEQLTASK